jgi:hypothetical protein
MRRELVDEGNTVIEPVSTGGGDRGVVCEVQGFRLGGRTLDLEIMRARKGVVRDFGGVWQQAGW